MFWSKLFAIFTSIVLWWLLYRYIAGNKEAFSLVNLNKSFFSLGILAIFLIGFVTIAVLFVKHYSG